MFLPSKVKNESIQTWSFKCAGSGSFADWYAGWQLCCRLSRVGPRLWNRSELAVMKWIVPVESRNARAIASGMSFGMQESCGVVKIGTREPSSTPVIVGVDEGDWPLASGALCAAETVIRAKPHRKGSRGFM